jgi:oligopeptide/dipeptide ABC transporter ATP-binding protein
VTISPGQTRALAALRRPAGLVSAVLVLAFVVLAVVGPMIWGEAARTDDVAHLLEGSSADHVLGTDNLGRDMLARVLTATRLSLVLAVLAVLVGAGIGVPLGALPSVLGMRAGRMVAALIDFALAFPALLLAMFMGIVLGVGATGAVIAIGIASAPGFARLTQTLAASIAGSDYVSAAKLLGVPRRRVLARHVLPNIAEPIILNTTVAIGYALLSMSGLSFIGLGVQSPQYDWGRLLDEALDRIYVTPEVALGPALAIVLAGLAFNGLGEALAGAASTRTSRVRRGRRQIVGHAPASADTRTSEAHAEPAHDAVLRVEDLSVTFPAEPHSVTPVRGVSFSVRRGELLGIVGESASGKSLTALAVAQLVPYPGAVEARCIEFMGHDLRTLPRTERERLLGRGLAMVFQDPSSSMNPAVRVGRQLSEVGEQHAGLTQKQARRRAVDRLRHVGIASPERRAAQFPHELSGGMRQRAMIAMGLMAQPALVIADEPTSALDVTVQLQVLRLLESVRDETQAAALLISHDIAVVAQVCDRVLVMYAGRVVEELTAEELIAGAASHPYTRALLASVPDMATDLRRPLATIPGRPPDPADKLRGCAFADRCASASERCRTDRPTLQMGAQGHPVACWHPTSQLEPSADPEQVLGA